MERQAVNQARVASWKTDRSRQEGADPAEVRGDGMDEVVLGSQWCWGLGGAGVWVVLGSGWCWAQGGAGVRVVLGSGWCWGLVMLG